MASQIELAAAFKAAKSGHGLILFRLSDYNPSYIDIFARIPTVAEMQFIRSIAGVEPEKIPFLEELLCDECIVSKTARSWLSREKAGLTSSVAGAIMLIAEPTDLETVSSLLDEARENQSFYDSMKQFVMSNSSLTSSDVDKLDIYQLLRLVASIERRLLDSEIMEQPIAIHTETAQGVSSGSRSFEEDAARMRNLLGEGVPNGQGPPDLSH